LILNKYIIPIISVVTAIYLILSANYETNQTTLNILFLVFLASNIIALLIKNNNKQVELKNELSCKFMSEIHKLEKEFLKHINENSNDKLD
jgi:hypothetical protein